MAATSATSFVIVTCTKCGHQHTSTNELRKISRSGAIKGLTVVWAECAHESCGAGVNAYERGGHMIPEADARATLRPLTNAHEIEVAPAPAKKSHFAQAAALLQGAAAQAAAPAANEDVLTLQQRDVEQRMLDLCATETPIDRDDLVRISNQARQISAAWSAIAEATQLSRADLAMSLRELDASVANFKSIFRVG